MKLDKVLIANRGEIACRVINSLKKLAITSVAIYSEADRNALHVQLADEAYLLPGFKAESTYLNIPAIIKIAKANNVDAIHPGYGFLSENPEFAEQLAEAGIIFIGPSATAIRQMGNKAEAKNIMAANKIPVVPGYQGKDQSLATLSAEAEKIGFPLLIKAEAGGGGKGMRKVMAAEEFEAALAAAQREAQASFANDKVLLEKLLIEPRHIEVQVIADQHGTTLHCFERDCSTQRRHQKVLEEAPAPNLDPEIRNKICTTAVQAAAAIDYTNAGTIEFLYCNDEFYFMEMNTRLQVEHPVTEAITGLDLVAWQLRIAAGERLPFKQSDISITGHAIEARLYAEDPSQQFLPTTGAINALNYASNMGNTATSNLIAANSAQSSATNNTNDSKTTADDKLGIIDNGINSTDSNSTKSVPTKSAPTDISTAPLNVDNGINSTAASSYLRIDNGIKSGDNIGIYYDPMLAKIIAYGPDRDTANKILSQALRDSNIFGITTNQSFLYKLCQQPQWQQAAIHTEWLTPEVMTAAASNKMSDKVWVMLTALWHCYRQQQMHAKSATTNSPWYSCNQWRLNEVHAEQVEFTAHKSNTQQAISLIASADNLRIHIDSQEYAINAHLDNGKLLLEFAGQKYTIPFLVEANQYHLFIDGDYYHFSEPLTSLYQADADTTNDSSIIAPMPGTVVKVCTEAGATVKRGDKLIILEAMKMEHTITAPQDGSVAKINFTAGQLVNAGAELMQFDVAENAS